MLLLGARNIDVDGVTVFSDHADPNQFWYLPAPVSVARDGAGVADFTFIKYKPAAVAAGVKGGGFVMFGAWLRVDAARERRILARLSELGAQAAQARLSPAPFDSGSVRCVALNLQGSGDGAGTVAAAAPPGTFNAVEKILGASVPELAGDNTAIFDLPLSQEGAIIVEQAFTQGTQPVGVIYDLRYTAIRPSLDVKITVDYKRVYDQFSTSIDARYYWFKAGIDLQLEFLRQTGAIKIEVTNYTDDADSRRKEDWALQFFTDKLLNDWFEPTLTLGTLQGASPTPTPTPTRSGTGTPTPSGTRAATPTPTAATHAGMRVLHTAQDAAGAIHFQIMSRDPDPSPNDLNITHTPAPSGTTERVTVTGGRNPRVRVDGEIRGLDASHQVAIDVQNGTSHEVVVDDPASPAHEDEFFLFFDFDKPTEQGSWVAGQPGSNARFQSYLDNSPSPSDTRYVNATTRGTEDPRGRPSADPESDQNGQPPVPAPHGADKLTAWLGTLADPKNVTVAGFASFEGNGPNRQAQREYNWRLSGRRADIAVGVIGSNAHVVGTPVWDGEETAHNTGTHFDDHWRVAKVRGTVAAQQQQAQIFARLSRDSGPIVPPTTTPTTTGSTTPTTTRTTTTTTPTTSTTTTPTTSGPTPTPSGTPGDPQLAFKLKYVHQEEQKTLVFEYHRQEAVQRAHTPQGHFGLLLGDLTDRERRFVEVDLDDPFFRVFTVLVDAPIDYQRLGLIEAHVALDYGSAADEQNHKHADFVFDAQNHAQKQFQVYMNEQRDVSYTYAVEYHFDPESGWDGSKYTYSMPAQMTSNRTLLVNPFEHLGFLEVRIFPERIDAQVVLSTDVHLSHVQPDGTVASKVINVTASSAPQLWRLRCDDPNNRIYSYFLVHNLKGGATRTTAPVTTNATVLPVDDPFDNSIDITFIPLFDPAQVREVIIDLEYDDPANSYQRRDRLTVLANQRDALLVRIAIFDATRRTYRYRLTYVTATAMNRGNFIDTTETLIGLFG